MNDFDDYVVEEITEEKKQALLEAINERFSFSKDGSIYCRECKNESVACVCMGDEG